MKRYYNSKDSYSIYKKLSTKPIELKVYLEIINKFFKFISYKLLNNGTCIFPERLGKLEVIGRKVNIRLEDNKIKGLAPDWIKTKELWSNDEEAKKNKQLVYYFNEHTNGIRYSIKWLKNRVLVENKTLYDLILTRTNKRNLSNLIKQGKEYLIKD